MIYRDPKDWGPALKTRLEALDMQGKTDAERLVILRAETEAIPQVVPAAKVAEALFIGRTIVNLQAALANPAVPTLSKSAIGLVLAAIGNRDSLIDLRDPDIKATVDSALADIYAVSGLVPQNVQDRLSALMYRTEPVWPPELDEISLNHARSL